MSTTIRVTADNLFRMPDDGDRYELVQGELIRMNLAGAEHGAVIGEIAGRLYHFVNTKKIGRVFGAEAGFILERNPDTVPAPDVAFVSRARLETTGLPRAFYPGAPDLAVEVVSPGDTAAEVENKARAWLAAGSQLVWNVRPITRVVEVYRASATKVEILSEDDTLSGDDVVSGFTCRVSEIFPQRSAQPRGVGLNSDVQLAPGRRVPTSDNHCYVRLGVGFS